ncbi:MAG: Gx transporter family protein [Candidatus Wallbacteria bacterium]|nr:Gx transporter family protein [Candidatus Wallbacteria bacterium]
MSTRSQSNRISQAGLLLALSVAAGFLDSAVMHLFPVFPFLRIGLANIFVLIAVLRFPGGIVAALVAGKVLIPHAVCGTLFSAPFMLGLSGSVLSAAGMWITAKTSAKSSILLISLCGAALHNCGQWLALKFFMPQAADWFLLGFLTGMSPVTGLLTASAAAALLHRVGGMLFENPA